MNGPSKYQLALLRLAVGRLQTKDYSPYLTLLRLLAEKPPGYKAKFEPIFVSFYGLNTAHLGEAFHREYFRCLFGLKLHEGVDPYAPILRSLYKCVRRKGDNALQCSFVTKLVAIHDESRPIFDRHVGGFFGISAPAYGNLEFKISGFVENLCWLRAIYNTWSDVPSFQKILVTLKIKSLR